MSHHDAMRAKRTCGIAPTRSDQQCVDGLPGGERARHGNRLEGGVRDSAACVLGENQDHQTMPTL